MGAQTVASTYESVALDEHINSFGLAYGLGMEADVWERRLADFQGAVIEPESPVLDRGHTVLPWDKWVEAMQDSHVVAARAACNSACVRLVATAHADWSVNPVRRYRDARATLVAYRLAQSKQLRQAAVLVESDAAIQRLRTAVNRAMRDALAMQREGIIQTLALCGYRLRVRDPFRLDQFGLALAGLAGDGAALFVDRANNRGGGFGINELRLEIMNLIGVSGSPWQNMWVAML